MLHQVHPAAVILVVVSILLLAIVPVAAWQTLEKTDDPKAARLWFGGLLANAAAILVHSLPSYRHPIVTAFALALTTLACFMLAAALRRLSGRPLGTAGAGGWLSLCVFALVFTIGELGAPDLAIRSGFLLIVALLVGWLLLQLPPLYRLYPYRSLVLLGIAGGAVGLFSTIRGLAYFIWGISPYFLSFSITGQMGWVVNLLSSVLFSFGYWNFALERARQSELEARLKIAEATGRAEEAERSNTQLRDLVRERDEMLIVNSRLTGLNSASVFGAVMIHELNQYLEALTARLGAAHLMGKRAKPELRAELAEAAKLTEAVSSSIRPLRSLLVTGTPSREPVNVAAEVQSICGIIGNACMRDNIAFSLTIATDCRGLTCLCDRALLVRVVMNVAHNAIEELTRQRAEAPEKPCAIDVFVDRATASGHDCVRIGVRDSGPGFPSDMLSSFPALMDTRKETGTGIGLALAQMIIRSWGGEIAISNDGGASVRMSIPIATAAIRRGAA